jgi:hypothetical protein
MASEYDGPRSLWTIQDGFIRLQATGLPYHSYGNEKSKYKATYKNYDVKFEYRGGKNEAGIDQPTNGLIGYWLNGVAIYSPSSGETIPDKFGKVPNFNYNASYQSTKKLKYNLNHDMAGGHVMSPDSYCYHDFSFASAWIVGSGSIPQSFKESEVKSIPYLKGGLTHGDGHSKILGFALDGYPIYGPYGYKIAYDQTGGVEILKSGYSLKDASVRNINKLSVLEYPMGIFVEDYEFVGDGALDKHNGRHCITPDFPGGTYAYFVSTDTNQNPVFPYVIGETFYGQIPERKAESNFTPIPEDIKSDTSPIWNTSEGNIGKFLAGKNLYFGFNASYQSPATKLSYKLLNGDLPKSLKFDANGFLTGEPDPVKVESTYKFSIRATDTIGLIKDRTFEITIIPSEVIALGSIDNLIIEDSVYTEIPLQFSAPLERNSIRLTIPNGKLPPGLELTREGLIRGYPKPPLSLIGGPSTAVYKFTIKYENDLGTVVTNNRITVRNQRLAKAPNTRPPAILNKKPLQVQVSKSDPYYDYYIMQNEVPKIKSGDFFTFKIIGFDFDDNQLVYEFMNLPDGMVGDYYTGWLSGTPIQNSKGYNIFRFSVRVKKQNNDIGSKIEDFEYIVYNDVKNDIVWETNSDLGTIFNNTISELSVKAKSSNKLEYRLVSGTMPPNLKVLKTGDISGKVVNQPSDKLLLKDDVTKFTFEVEAICSDFPTVSSKKQFTIDVKQYYTVPTETMYFRANPSLEDRKIVDSLLKDENLIPTDFLYKPEDSYFGKAKDIKFVQVYGMNAATIEQYVSAIDKNHYWRYVVLGDVKTAVAKNDAGEIIYEVVYSEIKDDLDNSKSQSINKTIIWPRLIPTGGADNITSEGEVFTSYEKNQYTGKNYTASLADTYTDRIYPASFQNMRKQIASVLKENYDSRLLPKWMSSQQRDGNVLGYVQAWVICYTLPNRSETIANNIKNNWGHKLNEIYFVLDRYTIDKSNTFDYNKNLATPSWENLPSSSPAPDPLESKDFYVLFPRKTILPK